MTEPVRKKKRSYASRVLRGIGSILDPRAFAHLIKIVNYYNYTHVQELRLVTRGRDVRISPTASFSNGRNIVLGDRVSIGAHTSIWAGPGAGKIILEDDVLLGPSIMITAANYKFNEGSPVTDQPMTERDVLVGKDAWIGHGAIVLPGAQIGAGAVVAAGTVVRGTVEPFSIVSGNPMVVIGQREIS